MLNKQKILILAPHTDDGELGCGASISKFLSEGSEVTYIAFSTCSQALPAHLPKDSLVTECRAATKALGINNVIFFDFEVRRLLFHRQEILEELIRINQQSSPDTVFLPAENDVHQDHQVIYAEGLRAFKNCNVFGYELPWNNFRFQPNYFERVTEEHLEVKQNALQQYRSQAHKKYMDPDFIRSLATVRGMQANSKLAEAFEVYRMIS
ncbi:MAG TPA: PIG-L deacetylase family protein [Flavisolibacter sp.]|nr:PIG-L deacetylase family protein [Flavisolibacter sp.]